MALPIAQLGYMPNMNAPSHGGHTIVEDPWAKILQMVVANVATTAATNAMSKDYSDQAQTEGLVPNGGPAGDTPDNAPWYKKMLSGPTMNERQYSAANDRMANRDSMRSEHKFRTGEADKARRQETERDNARMFQQNSQFDRTIGLNERELAQKGQAADRQTMLQGGELENARRRTDLMANPPTPASDPDVMKRVVGSMASDVYKTRMEQWSRVAGLARATGQTPPPEPTYEQAVMEAAQAAAKHMNLSPQSAPTAPAIPLVDPSLLHFGP